MGNVVYEHDGGHYIVVGRDGMKVVLQEVSTGRKIKVSGRKFMSDEFRAVHR